MRVVTNDDPVSFDSIPQGSVYKTAESSLIFMKSTNFTAVCLNNGSLTHVPASIEVIPKPNAIIYVDGKE